MRKSSYKKDEKKEKKESSECNHLYAIREVWGDYGFKGNYAVCIKCGKIR